MKITKRATYWTVEREPAEPRCATESAFWYRLKRHCQAAGLDVVKKAPEKDGHMTSAPYYLRERKWKFAIEDGNAAIELIHRPFNLRESVHLIYHDWTEQGS